MKGIYKKVKKIIRYAREISIFFRSALKYSRSLKCVQNNGSKIKKGDIILFSTMKNEGHRLDYFFNYYRRLGVSHFVIVDNASTDLTNEICSKFDDITLYYTSGSYKDSNFGMHWLNYLLFKYGRNHWCLTCDPDEFLVYPNIETRDLVDLTQYLSSIRQDSFFALMIDMYSQFPVSETTYEPGTDPIISCPYFDGSGYSRQFDMAMHNLYVQGGVRRRVFSNQEPSSSPALNKVPLIFWKWNYAYVSSMHMALPKFLNRCVDDRKVTGALLHYKFISQLDSKVKEEMVAKQHYNDSAEYKQYEKVINKKDLLYDKDVSVEYIDWKSLANLGLMNLGEWVQ